MSALAQSADELEVGRRSAGGQLPRVWFGLGAASTLGLLTYPLPTAWLGLAGLVALALARWHRLGSPLPPTRLNLVLGLYLAGALIGLIVSTRSSTAEVRFFGVLAAIGAFLLVLETRNSPNSLGRLTHGALLLAVVLMALVFLLVAPRLQFERLPGPLASHLISWQPTLEYVRSDLLQLGRVDRRDDFEQRYRLFPSGLGLLAVYGFGLALGPLLVADRRRTRLLAGLAVAYFGGFTLLSGNRGAMLNMTLVLAIVGLSQSRMRGRYGVAAAMVVGAGVTGLVLRGDGSALSSLLPAELADPGPFQVRLEYWQNALFLLSDFRFTGVGLGIDSARQAYDSYFLSSVARPHRGFPFVHAHNMFIQTYLEQGLLGLLGLLGLVAVTLAACWRSLARRPPEAASRRAALSASAAALGLILNGLTEVAVLTTIGSVLLFGTVAVLLASVPKRSTPLPAPPLLLAGRIGPRQWVALGTGMLVLMIVTVALSSGLWAVRQAARGMAAQFSLNLGAVEIRKAAAALEPTMAQQHLAHADNFLRQARTDQPESTAVYRNLAAAALVGTRPDEALHHLEQAGSLAHPEDDRSFFQIGRLYREMGSVERALDAWSWVRLLPTSYTGPEAPFGAWSGAGVDAQLIAWGATLVEERNWGDAIAVNQAAIQLSPISRRPYRALASAIAEAGQPETALEAMQALAARYPEVPWSYQESARIERMLGRLEAAERLQERAALAQASEAWAARVRVARGR